MVKRRIYIKLADDMDTAVVYCGQYEAALSAVQQQIWNGEGLPPVGVTCEHCPGGTTQHEWEVVTVIAISERPGGAFTDYWLRKENGGSYIVGNPYRFRPLRSESERKRHETLYALEKLDIDSDITVRILDAITACEIPHITLK